MCPEAPYPGSAVYDLGLLGSHGLCKSALRLSLSPCCYKAGASCRRPYKSCLSPSDESLVGPTLVPTIHKLALHLIEMEGLIHQPGQSLKFFWLQDRGYIPALFPFSMEILLSGPAAFCVFMRQGQPQAPTAVPLFSMLGLGRRKPAVRPGVLEEAHLISCADAWLLQACWAPSAGSHLWRLLCTCCSNPTLQAL